MSFWGELKRRNVYKVGVAYAIVAWLLIQFAAIAFPHLNFPSWAVPFVIIIFIIGFPLALLLAWAYEVTPEGIKRTKEVPLAESITHLTGQKLNFIVMGLLVLAVAYLLFDKFYLERRATESEIVTTESEQVPAVADVEEAKKTIAVLPFVNLSPDPDQEYFVDGLSEEIINSLTQIPNLGVTGRTSSFTFKGSNKKTQEIANELGVENILEGSVRKAGNSLRITAQLVRAADDLHLWSKTYDRELKDIFEVQEDIATSVVNELKVTLGIGESLRPLGGTDNVEAYEHYLKAQGQYRDIKTDLALKSLDAALALDPEFALAWASKAIIHTFLVITGPANHAVTERKSGLLAAEKAVELEPNLGAGYYSLGYAKSVSGDFIGAKMAYSKGLNLTNEPLSFIMPVIPIHYIVVGYFDKANKLLEQMLRNDPLSQGNRAWYIDSFVLLGDTQRAYDEDEHAKILFGNKWGFSGSGQAPYIRLFSGNVLNADEIINSDIVWNTVMEHLDSPKDGIASLQRLYTDKENLPASDLQNIVSFLVYFGDPEFAMDVMDKSIKINAEGIEYLYYPIMRGIRQTPRFKKLVKEIGLVDYWKEFGWPDICHKLDNGDFVCD